MDESVNEPFDSAERERMAAMLENWFQQRMALSNRAFKFMFLPIIAVVVFAAAFWFSYYLPVPVAVSTAGLVVSLAVWMVCLFLGGRLMKRVRTGDSLMLRKIRSSSTPAEG